MATPQRPVSGGMGPEDQQKLKEIERLCEMMYSGRAEEMEHATKQLGGFMNDMTFIPHCQFVLDNSRNQYALMAAAQSLLRLTTQFWNVFNHETTIEMRNYMLTYLARNCEQLPKVIVRELLPVPCRITKLGWDDKSFEHREIIVEITKFLQASVRHCVVGIQLLCELIHEMNNCLSGKTLTEHRKVAVSFRDKSLQHIFQISLTSLKQILQKKINFSDAKEEDELTEQALRLSVACLTFDFIGTNPDESSSDFGSLQIPAPWKSMLETPETIQLFMSLFKQSEGPRAAQCIEVLVKLASCRRSLFTNDESRASYLSLLCEGTVEIMQNYADRLKDDEVYIHFCRLLVSLKSNYQLVALAKVQCYSRWIELVSQFTIQSFNSWEWAANSVHYLVALWARLTLSIPYMRGDVPTFLESFIPQVSASFIQTRLDAVGRATSHDDLDDLFEQGDLDEQLRHLPTLCRYQYERSYDLIVSRMDPLINTYKLCIEAITQNRMNPEVAQQLRITEGQLSWLIYTIGSIIAGNAISGAERDQQRQIDARLCARVFQLVHMVDFRLMNQNEQIPCLHHLDMAILYFYQQFRRGHIGYDGSSRTMRSGMNKNQPLIYNLLAEHLGPTDQKGILSAILKKIVTDLKAWSQNALVVDSCLDLFNDISSGYSSFKLLVELDTSREILGNHTEECFPFLKIPANSKLRTKFYATLGRIVFAEPNIDYFDQFMQPFEATFHWIDNEQDCKSDEVKFRTIGLCRDLRGIVSACANRVSYNEFFDWFYPKYFQVYLRLFESYWNTHEVSIPMLRFMSEFVNNKAQRIVFPASSPNGIHLFRAASKVLQTYGKRQLHSRVQINVKELYKKRYKGISIAMQILSRALGGQYVNFGVFELYKDQALSMAVNDVMDLTMSIPMPELLVYQKISKIYYQLLEVLFRHHIQLIITDKNAPKFGTILGSLVDGIQNPDSSQSSLAACAIDHIASYRFNMARKRNKPPALERLESLIANDAKDYFTVILTTLFNLIIFENISNQWSLSRPILPLIFTNRNGFNNYIQQLAGTQPPEVHSKLKHCFEELMAGIQSKLETKNRERFTQNLVVFKKNLRDFCVKPPT